MSGGFCVFPSESGEFCSNAFDVFKGLNYVVHVRGGLSPLCHFLGFFEASNIIIFYKITKLNLVRNANINDKKIDKIPCL